MSDGRWEERYCRTGDKGSEAMEGRGPGSWPVEYPRIHMGLSGEEHKEPGVRCEAVCCGSTRDVFAFENQGDYDRALANVEFSWLSK